MGSKNEFRNFNPFPGLRPFAQGESNLFFGREKESNEVLDKLLGSRFVTVMGASGTGKSSLIYCGVIPKIRELGQRESLPWNVITFRPGNDPYGNLSEAISGHISNSNLQKVNIENVVQDMQLNPNGIADAIRKYLVKGNERTLLVVDQFEELLRYSILSAGGTKGRQGTGFIEKIVNALLEPDSKIFIIITMRSDLIGECAQYQGLTQLINNSNYLVPRMERENYRQVIEGPVKYAGATVDPKLTEKILDDIGERTDQLAVLQHALMRTWTYWQQLDEPGRPVSFTDYDAVGTMSGAMSRHANEAYEELTPRGREVCEKMFRTITEKGTDNKGIRNPSGVNYIKSVIQCTSQELFGVVEKFRIPSRSFITPAQDIPLNDESIIDLSHESLIRLWDRLRDWVDEEAASVQMYLRLSEASAMYQQGKASLWRPPDLQLAINWRDQQKPTLPWAQRYDPAFERAMVYLRTSEKAYFDEEESKIRLQKRKMRRTRIAAALLGTASLVSIGFMLFAFVQKMGADRQTDIAINNQKHEEMQRVAADSIAYVAGLNAEEAEKQRNNALLEQERALDYARIAREQERIAVIRSDSARQAMIRSDTSAANATKEKYAALRLRMLSLGKSMSLKSLQLEGQKDLQTLLAYQAYIFNKRNNGPDNDADIFNGLYNVSVRYGNVNYKSFRGHNGQIKSIAFIPDRKEFFTSGDDGQVLKWNLDDRPTTYQVIYSGSDIIEVLAVSPDASWLACGSGNSLIRMIPLKTNNMQYELSGHKDKVKSLIFSYDGKYLYSASLDGKVLKWDMATRTSTDVTTGTMKITSIDVSSNGNYLAGINEEENVIVWNPETRNDNFRIETTRENIRVIRFKPEENILALGDMNGNVELWDINSRKKISEVKAHSSQINDIRFNTARKQMATAGTDKTSRIFDISNMTDLTEPPVTLSDNDGFVLVMQFSPDGRLLISGSNEKDRNLTSRPAHVDNMAGDICSLVTRNMTQEEWNAYVARDIPLEKTCTEKDYKIKVDVMR